MKKNNPIKDIITLCLITLVLSFMLSIVKHSTNDIIENQNLNKIKQAYVSLMPSFDHSTDYTSVLSNIEISSDIIVDSCLLAYNANDEKIGYIITTINKGFNGDIKLIVGINNDLRVVGIAFPEILNETPGLGMKVTEPEFASQFIGKQYSSIDTVDTISGATISSKAVKDSVVLDLSIVEKLVSLE